MQELEDLERRGELGRLVSRIRGLVGENRRVLAEPFVHAWCARRWRDLFLREAERDARAFAAATRGRGDTRSPRQRLAERYLEGEGIEVWKEELPAPEIPPAGALSLLFCPGLLNGLLPVRAFERALPVMEERFGWNILRADCHPLAGCEANAGDIERALERGEGLDAAGELISPDRAEPPGDVMIVAYSKGGPDVFTLLARRPELASRVRAIFLWATPMSGSTISEGPWKRLEGLGERFETKAQHLLRPLVPRLERQDYLRRVGDTDITDAVRDLTPEVRERFLEEHTAFLESLEIPVFTFAASTTLREVPYFQATGFCQLRKQDPHNDMQVISASSRLPSPMAIDLGLVHGHHWDIAYPPFPKHLRLLSRKLGHPFPKQAAITAMALLAAELGLAG